MPPRRTRFQAARGSVGEQRRSRSRGARHAGQQHTAAQHGKRKPDQTSRHLWRENTARRDFRPRPSRGTQSAIAVMNRSRNQTQFLLGR